MKYFTPFGGDGAPRRERLQLGQIYQLIDMPSGLCAGGDLPRHGYVLIYAVSRQIVTLQVMPTDTIFVAVSHTDMGYLIDNHAQIVPFIDATHMLKEWIQLVLTITAEFADLIQSNPELLTDWKIYCLYPPLDFRGRVKATYRWLTRQDDWFETDPQQINWHILTEQLIASVNRPPLADDDFDDPPF